MVHLTGIVQESKLWYDYIIMVWSGNAALKAIPEIEFKVVLS